MKIFHTPVASFLIQAFVFILIVENIQQIVKTFLVFCYQYIAVCVS